jgi:hypothetical protein
MWSKMIREGTTSDKRPEQYQMIIQQIRNHKGAAIAVTLIFLFAVTMASLCMATFPIGDWYFRSVIGKTSFEPLHYSGHNDLYSEYFFTSTFEAETTDTYGQITAGYKQRGWDCDGVCEDGGVIDLGIFRVDVLKRAGTSKGNPSRNSQLITVYENYCIIIPALEK